MKGHTVAEAIEEMIKRGATVREVKLPAPSQSLSVIPLDLSEAEFQKLVIDEAHARGWRVAHFRAVRVQRGKSTYWETPVAADGAGFPDLELVRERLVKVELKVKKNKRSANQLAWANAYGKAGVEYYLWYPRDWSTILEVLR